MSDGFEDCTIRCIKEDHFDRDLTIDEMDDLAYLLHRFFEALPEDLPTPKED